MADSKVNDVIDALTTGFTSAAGLAGVPVSKGFELLAAGDVDHVFVAGDGDPAPEDEVASSDIEWSGLQAMAERGTVVCACWSQTGDSADMAGRITRAYELLGTCMTVVKAGLALTGEYAFQALITGTRLRTVQDTEGCAAVVVFDVSFSITS